MSFHGFPVRPQWELSLTGQRLDCQDEMRAVVGVKGRNPTLSEEEIRVREWVWREQRGEIIVQDVNK